MDRKTHLNIQKKKAIKIQQAVGVAVKNKIIQHIILEILNKILLEQIIILIIQFNSHQQIPIMKEKIFIKTITTINNINQYLIINQTKTFNQINNNKFKVMVFLNHNNNKIIIILINLKSRIIKR